MADVSTLEQSGGYWEEVTDALQVTQPPKAEVQLVAKRNADPMHMICRCWRCRGGGVSFLDMPGLDRILARQLLRISEAERLAWLRDWELNPNHGAYGRYILELWIKIESGFRYAEPAYYTVVPS